MTLVLVPLVLIGPVMALAAAAVALAAHGPLGVLAAGALLVGVAAATRWSWRCCCRWWAGTRAPEQPPRPARARPVPR